jgi:hypothetical protein
MIKDRAIMCAKSTRRPVGKWQGAQTFGCITTIFSISVLVASLGQLGKSGSNKVSIVFGSIAAIGLLLGVICSVFGRVMDHWFGG